MSEEKREWRTLRIGLVAACCLLAGAALWGEAKSRKHWTGAEPGDFPGSKTPPSKDEKLKGYSAKWVPFEARKHPVKPTPIWGNVRRPYPTGAWWTNLVVGGPSSSGDGLGSAMQTPYAVSVTPERGVALSYGALSAANLSLTISVSCDVGVSLDEGAKKRYVTDYDDLTMTMRLEGPGDSYVDTLFARGSPFSTFYFNGATPSLVSDFEIDSLTLVSSGAAPSKKEEKKMPRECSAYPSCIQAGLSGNCCPMDKEQGSLEHLCCETALAEQGPGEIFSLVLKSGQHWRIYTSSPVTLTWSPLGGVLASKPFDGIMRVALVPDDSGLGGGASLDEGTKKANETSVKDAEMLDAYAETYAVSGVARHEVDRSRDASVGQLTFFWRVAYMGSTLSLDSAAKTPPLLMLALPHHVNKIVADETVGFLPWGSLDYRGGLKGHLTPILGRSWKMRLELTPISWLPPKQIDDIALRNELGEILKGDVARPNAETDDKAAWIAYDNWFGNAYWNGKEAARLATLALIAENIRQEPSRVSAYNQLEAILEVWLEGKNKDPLVYDATYGGLCTKIGLYDHDADFGNGYYNDHHFHYGYMLYAAAVAVKMDASFRSKYRRQLLAIMYDIANPGESASSFESAIDRSAFPRSRHKDFYEGHSWASGIFFMGQGKAQESSSEAINAYYGSYLLALAFGDVELADWNRVLLAMEIDAAKTYYHMPKGTPIYPPIFAQNKMVGVLGALSTGAVTWFGPSVAFSHGIQILPVTPITELVLQPATFIREDLEYLDKHLDRDSCGSSWLAFIESLRAVVDPRTAWDNIKQLQSVDAGTTKTALLFWVATRTPPDDMPFDSPEFFP